MFHVDLPPIYVLRHGETEWNLADRMQGWCDSPLTALGRAQAEAQGRLLRAHLPEGCGIRISPSGRAVETAQIALGARARAAVLDVRLREVNVGDWVGRTPQEIAAEHVFVRPDEDRHLWKFHAPGGETLEQMTARCRGVLAELTGPSVLVTHGVTSRLLRCLALGRAPEALGDLPGGQGIVHVIEDGKARILRE
ncbi:histidine phosphatase family protein [Gymnodinialimonas ulvae]|uniref:histidine phosphatase family protein n=1 Tax=Gymnodinialimonas ulvae TaxID=3126504 RepID=UPI00309E493C